MKRPGMLAGSQPQKSHSSCSTLVKQVKSDCSRYDMSDLCLTVKGTKAENVWTRRKMNI